MDHENHYHFKTTRSDYIKFVLVLIGILVLSLLLEWFWGNFSMARWMREFMAFFFLVFAMFKLYDLEGFVNSYIGYDLIAQKVKAYAYIYPFIELALAFGYFINWPTINWVTVIVTGIGALGVWQQLKRKTSIRCACLGTAIKLPLTTVSLVEDLGMGIMALILLVQHYL